MSKKIKVNYKVSKDMEISFSPEIEELAKYSSLDKLKSITKKYISEIDNQMNFNGKILKAGSLEFEIGKIKK